MDAVGVADAVLEHESAAKIKICFVCSVHCITKAPANQQTCPSHGNDVIEVVLDDKSVGKEVSKLLAYAVGEYSHSVSREVPICGEYTHSSAVLFELWKMEIWLLFFHVLKNYQPTTKLFFPRSENPERHMAAQFKLRTVKMKTTVLDAEVKRKAQ